MAAPACNHLVRV